ncbi:MAG: hypothetical protein PHY82_02630 [Lentisphaeria bacterium]|nr:hypothetical protein [Lentisphaeria bacterium]
MRLWGLWFLCLSLPAIASLQQMSPGIEQFSGCHVDKGIYRMLEALPGQQQQQNLVLEAENALTFFFQEDVFARKAGGKADELLQIKQSASEYSPQNDPGASNQKYIDYCTFAALPFHLATPGTYSIWFRVWVPKVANWNFDLLINGNVHNISLGGKIPAAEQWFWIKGAVCELSAGSHQLQLQNLMNGKRLDQILLTQQENFIPNPEPAETTSLTTVLQAEIHFKTLLPTGIKQWQKISFENTGGGTVEFSFSNDAGKHFEKLQGLDLSALPADKPLTLKMDLHRQNGVAPEIKALQIHYLLNDQDYLLLKNPGLELLFSKQTGALSGIRNPLTGSRYQPALPCESMFELLVKAPTGKQRRYLSFADAKLIACQGSETKVELHWKFPAEDIEVLFLLEARTELIDWKVTVLNRNPELDVLEIEAPRISRLRISDSPEGDTLVWPFSAGEFLSCPASRGTQSVAYPDHAGLPFVSLFNEKEGFYFALQDPLLVSSHFFTRGNHEQDAIELSIVRKHRIPAGKQQTYHFAVAGHEGDWHRSADLYRNFFYSLYPVNQYRPWLRNADAWLAGSNTGHGGLMRKRPDYSAMLLDFQYAAFLSLPYIQSWGSTFNGACPSYYLPRADKGGAQQFAEMIRFWRQYGQIGFYFHGNAVSPYYLLTDRYFTIPWEQYPAQYRPPSWEWFEQNREYSSSDHTLDKEHLLKQTARLNQSHADGEIISGNAEESLTGYMPMSWHSNAFPDFLRFWLTLYVRDFHCNTAYLDTFAFSNRLPDFNPHLGLHGEGDKPQLKKQWLDQWFEQMREIEPEFCALTEGVGDAFGTKLFFLLSGFARNPEIFRYTLPDQIFFQGTCNGLWTKPLAEKSLTQAFLVGNRLDLSVIFSQGYHALRLRQRISPFLNLAIFKDRVGLTCDNPAIQAYVHQVLPEGIPLIEHAGSKAITITLSNLTGTPGKISYKLPPDFTVRSTYLTALHETPKAWPFVIEGQTVSFTAPETPLAALVLIDEVKGDHGWTAVLEQKDTNRFTVDLFNFLPQISEFTITAENRSQTVSVAPGQNLSVEVLRAQASEEFAVIPVTIRTDEFSRTEIISLGKINRSIPRPEKSALAPVQVSIKASRPLEYDEPILDLDFESDEHDLHHSYTGKRSFRLSGDGGYRMHKFPLQLEANTTYQITVALSKGFEVSKVSYHNCVGVSNYSQDGKLTTYISLGADIPGDQKWHLLAGSFTTGPEVHRNGVYLYNRNSLDSVWVDDLRVSKIRQPK